MTTETAPTAADWRARAVEMAPRNESFIDANVSDG